MRGIVGKQILSDSREKTGNSVPPVMDGKDAGVIFESQLGQYLQRPQRIRPDGKLCSPVPAHRLPDDVFQHLLAAPRVFLKLLARQSVHDQVRVPV